MAIKNLILVAIAVCLMITGCTRKSTVQKETFNKTFKYKRFYSSFNWLIWR
ncbi:hypothetical protein [Arcobacter sp. CECT 8983]|uniref:hypothetical protein n=1 Tax=Arcobacter sp. CECT 8983 TaxID=2044508 RepID=UPI0013E903E7|nr:hypothetical protein [Arcobacter sp. CECT 8983]